MVHCAGDASCATGTPENASLATRAISLASAVPLDSVYELLARTARHPSNECQETIMFSRHSTRWRVPKLRCKRKTVRSYKVNTKSTTDTMSNPIVHSHELYRALAHCANDSAQSRCSCRRAPSRAEDAHSATSAAENICEGVIPLSQVSSPRSKHLSECGGKLPAQKVINDTSLKAAVVGETLKQPDGDYKDDALKKPSGAYEQKVCLTSRLEDAAETSQSQSDNGTLLQCHARLYNRMHVQLFRGLMIDAWQRWVSFSDHVFSVKQSSAALSIQTCQRRLIAARRLHQLRQYYLERDRVVKLALVDETVIRTRRSAIRIIQAFRLRRLRRRLSALSKSRNAVLDIQNWYRSIKANRMHLHKVAAYQTQVEAAIRIQCSGRRRGAYRRTMRIRKQVRLRRTFARYSTAREAIRYNFEQQGAAQRIQQWWKGLKWRNTAETQRLVRKAAQLITAAARKHLFRRAVFQKVRQRRRWRIAVMRGERRAVCRLQGGVRQFLDRRRAYHAGHQAIRSLKPGFIGLNCNEDRDVRKRLQHIIRFRPFAARTLKGGVILLQRRYRRWRARKECRSRRMNGIVSSKMLLQSWARRTLQRRARRHAALVITSWVELKWNCYLLKVKSSNRIAAAVRGFQARAAYKDKQGHMLTIALTLNKRVRAIQAHRRVRQLSRESRIRAENLLAGKRMFYRTRDIEIQRQVLLQSAVLDQAHESEVQRLFSFYCAYGQKSNTARLGISNFVRMVNDMIGLSAVKKNGTLSKSDTELIFMKSRDKVHNTVDSHLHYGGFLHALQQLARQLNEIGYTPCARMSVGTARPRDTSHTQQDNAVFCQFVLQTLLKSKIACNIVEQLGNRSFGGRADSRLVRAATDMERTWRRCLARQAVTKRRATFLAHHEHLRRIEAAQRVQRWIRGVAGRLTAALAAQRLYEKLFDHELHHEFWYNPRTYSAVWCKPRVLAWLDVINVVPMPEPDRLFEVRCTTCSKRPVTNFCVDCKVLFCEKCRIDRHARIRYQGASVVHTFVQTEVCVHCRFQVGTKRCRQCKDDYCDTCYFDQHANGLLQTHKFEKLVPHCDKCEKYAARKTGGALHGSRLCYRCLSYSNSLGGESNASFDDIPYVPMAVVEYFKQLEEERARVRLEMQNAERIKLMKKQKEHQSAITAQRALRGWLCRLRIAAFLTKRREWLAQRVLDGHSRRRVLYRIRDFFGVAPLFVSDTDMEIVLKSVPYWGRPNIREVVNGRWCLFANYVRDHHKFVEGNGRASTIKLAAHSAARLRGMIARQRALLIAHRAQNRFNQAQLSYRIARSSNQPADVLERLRTEMRKRRHDRDEKIKIVNRADQRLASIKAARSNLFGPRQFKQKVREVMRTGHLVKGITLSVERGSNFAQLSDSTLDGGSVAIASRFGIKIGDRLCVSSGENSKNVRLLKNHSIPSMSLCVAIQLRSWGKMILQYISPEDDTLLQGTRSETAVADEVNREESRQPPEWTLETTNTNKLRFNTIWTYNTSERATVRRYPRKRLPGHILDLLCDMLCSSVLIQFPIKAEMAMRCAIRRQLESLASKVDEGSNTERSLRQYADRQIDRCEKLSHSLVRPFDADRGLGIRKSCLYVCLLAKILLMLPFRAAYRETMIALEIRAEKRDALYRCWEESENKVVLTVELVPLEDTDDSTKTPYAIGTISLDLNCPLDIAREFIRRALWRDLNLICGAAYDFTNVDGVLDGHNEASTKLRRIVAQRLQNTTQDMQRFLQITPSNTRAKVDLEPYSPKPSKRERRRQARRRRKKEAKKSIFGSEEELWSDEEVAQSDQHGSNNG